MQFPDRENYHSSEPPEGELGFRAHLQPASVVAQELTPIGVPTGEGGDSIVGPSSRSLSDKEIQRG
jgi:hypothetical protein